MKIDAAKQGLDRRWFLGAAAGAVAWGCSGRDSSAAPAPAKAAPAKKGPQLVRLGSNENPYGPSPAALAAIRAAVAESFRYSDAEEELIATIAARHGVSAEHVVLGSGSYGILVAAVAAIVQRGDATVVSTPVYNVVETRAKLAGPVTSVPLDRAAVHDLDAMTAAIKPATRLVYVCNPNNPTGTLLPPADLRAFCRRHAAKSTILVDEAYAEYIPGFESTDALLRDGLPIIVTRTFSKLYGLAGLRVGYAIAPPAIAAAVRRARGGGGALWISNPGARAAIASLDDAPFVDTVRREVDRERKKLAAALQRLGVTVADGRANFVYFAHPRAEAVAAAMLARGVKIAGGTGCRISIGLPSDMAAATAALAAVLPTLS